MHQRKGKKILIYFFLLLLVGSINNIALKNLKFKDIKDINVIGLGNEDNSILLKKIKNLNLENIFFINKNEITDQISSNNLVEKYEIFKRYPSSLDIDIKKTKFLARITSKGKIFLVGSNGKLSKNNFLNNQLPFIFGKPDIDQFIKFKKNIDQSEISYDEIKNLYFFSSKRWDLELKNNVMIKLSRDYTEESLKLALEFLHNNEFRHIKIIDARVKNQIILND
jgi:cell division protein FtsQ